MIKRYCDKCGKARRQQTARRIRPQTRCTVTEGGVRQCRRRVLSEGAQTLDEFITTRYFDGRVVTFIVTRDPRPVIAYKALQNVMRATDCGGGH